MLAVDPSTESLKLSKAVTPELASGWLPLFYWPLLLIAVEGGVTVHLPHPWAVLHPIITAAIVFVGAFLLFIHRRLPADLGRQARFSRGFATLHGVALLLGIAAEIVLLHSTRFGGRTLDGVLVFWWVVVAVLFFSATAMVLPPRAVIRKLNLLRIPLACAFLVSLLVMRFGDMLNQAWSMPSSRLGHIMQIGAFRGVDFLLKLFYSDVVVDPRSFTIGTTKFQAQIAGPCSGVEGLALIFVLTVGWLIVMRRELRLRRAIWLVPIALVAIWCLNLVRIAALLAIGDMGHPTVAVGGFHSQAGWITLNLVGLAFLISAEHIPWLRRNQENTVPGVVVPVNLAAVYLLPFLAIVAASLISQAATGSFEWLYPLRLFAALAVLWFFRAEYKRMDWKFGWLGPLAGSAVFLFWIGLAHLPAFRPAAASTLPASLAALSRVQRLGWLTLRVLAAVITVPIAEELAFRGYIARRLMSADIETVPYRCLTLLAILLSSLLFGALHGRLWFAGVLAGIVFALVARKRDRLGEAVAAHAVANLLLAVWVLSFGAYSLW